MSDPTPTGPGGSSESSDPNTDPGRPHPYESLYRSATGETVRPSRPTPRHFEQHLSRPEGAAEGFGWLYRDESPATDPARSDPSVPGTPLPPPREPDSKTPDSAQTAPQPTSRSRRRGLRIALILLLLLTLVGVLVAALLVHAGRFTGI